MPGPLDAFPRIQVGGTVAPDPGPPSPSGFFANFGLAARSSWTLARGEGYSGEDLRLDQGYKPILDALNLPDSENPAGFSDVHISGAGFGGTATLKSSQLKTRQTGDHYAMVSRSEQEQLIAAEIGRRRAVDPNFLKDVPADVDGLHGLFLKQEEARRVTARADLARTRGAGGVLGEFAGGAGAMMTEAPNLLMLPAGGAGRTVAARILMEGASMAGMTAAEQPVVAQNRAALGEDYGAGDFAMNVGGAFAGGALFRGGGELLHAGGGAAGRQVRASFPDWARQRDADAFGKAMGRAVEMGGFSDADLPRVAARLTDPSLGLDSHAEARSQMRVELRAGTIDDRALAAHFRLAVPDALRTPDENAALAHLDRSSDIAEANPYSSTPAGLTAHGENFAAAARRVANDAPGVEIGPDNVPRVTPPSKGVAAAAHPAVLMSPDQIVRFVQNDLEGGAKVVHFSDADGGTTKFGIAAVDHPGVDVANLSEDEAARIARKKYWLPEFYDHPATAPIAFDAYYIHGNRNFALRLAAMDDPAQALRAYRAMLDHIADTVPGKAKFKRGWNNRVDKLAHRLGSADAPFAPAEIRPSFSEDDPGVEVIEPDALPAAGAEADAAGGLERPTRAVVGEGPEDVQAAISRRVQEALAAERPVFLDRDGVTQRIVHVDELGLHGANGGVAPLGDLVTPPDGAPPRLLLGPEPLPAVDVKVGGVPTRTGRRELLQEVAAAGGVRDDEGHALVSSRGLPKFVLGAGKVVRRDGRTVDALGEHLWEQGWFGPHGTTPRPSEADVLHLLDRAAAGEKVYRPEDRLAVADRAAANARMSEEEARFTLAQAGREEGLHLDPATLDDALTHLADGETVEGAVGKAMDAARFRDTDGVAGLERFDDADGEAFKAALDSMEHDVRMDAVGEGPDAPRLQALLEDLDREKAGADALRACMAPGGVA